ncbi:hypothetical protein BOW53_05260 [Solemya pervernicosa gill symbiont]|uniref:C-methyltransferase domain-containing protein n=2 Tax=Gammaproteobacteria incertae sedis TaxID=118884 RepID=A0A1T2L861_9GAMM|nr:class I SAM-dependent methyltransferase [Candidatus Reidiella endopervernicosa]OOZ41136.1 hypothetical protein BOW53_05260 [Solemya pervernicosa gill symbiont]QKQ26306.1 methyltransferase domain-containing protein [Candidatus Reidiella endopervernicosa]
MLPEPFFRLSQLPLFCNVHYADADSARAAARGDIELVLCPECQLITNRAFDSMRLEYSDSYENALHFSPVFRDYASSLAADLIERFELQGKRIVELGAGDGHFLGLLCADGINRGVGFDPALRISGETPPWLELHVGEHNARQQGGEADLIVARHLLEHLQAPLPYVKYLLNESMLKNDGALYLEVPDGRYMLEQFAFWDVIYEHVLYFSDVSLGRLLRRAEAGEYRISRAFGDQFLYAEVDREGGLSVSEPSGDLQLLAERFAAEWNSQLSVLEQRIAVLSSESRKIAIWGAGSKGVTFSNLVNDQGAIKAFIDINERKQHSYAAGSGVPIMPPEYIKQHDIDTILIMNANYQHEIKAMVRDLGGSAECITIK